MTELSRPVRVSDIEYIAEHMRTGDREEVEALGFEPLTALNLSVQLSLLCMTLVCPKTGKPGALLGVTKTEHDTMGGIWMLGTDAIEHNAMCFLRMSRKTLPELYARTGYASLGNRVYGKNTLHIKWLRWLGFKILRPVEYGPRNEVFYEFIRLG